MRRLFVITVALSLLVATGSLGSDQSRQEKAMAEFMAKTGLEKVEIPDTGGEYLAKEHRGYRVLFTTKVGNVWGRWAARVAIGEIGREAGGVWSWLTGSYEYGPGVTGSPIDRLLSEFLGQPLSILLFLRHGREEAPGLQIVSGSSTIAPSGGLPEVTRIGWGAGHLYSADADYAANVQANAVLIERIKKYRGQCITVDDNVVSFVWAGPETEFSAMIRDHPSYEEMILSIIDTLVDLAEAIPDAR